MAADIKLHTASGGSVTLVPDDSLTTDETVIVQDPIGVNQTWQNVGSQRDPGVEYTNDTGRPIQVSITAYSPAGEYGSLLTIDGISLALSQSDSRQTINAVVPNGSTYSIDSILVLSDWCELK